MPTIPLGDPDPFDLLRVSEWSSDEVINAAWRRLIRLSHPDYATDDADRERRLAKSIALNQAHDVLLDPASKAEALLERHRRTGAPVQAGYPQESPQSPPTQPEAPDAWARSRSSSYRAGGHPEARGSWSYSAEAATSQASAQAQASESLVRRRSPAFRILVVTVRIFVETGWALLRVLARACRWFLRPFDVDEL